MKIRFWGVRGSIPTPLTPLQVQNRIAAVVQRMTERDVASPDSRERFLSSLPEWIFGTVGGNTSCVELETSRGDCIIFDAGSGLRELSLNLRERIQHRSGSAIYHIFFSHFHWDHIQGLPFFSQGFNPTNKIIFYSIDPSLREYLSFQMQSPYFPVPLLGPGGFNAEMSFVHLSSEKRSMCIDGTEIQWLPVNHPGGCTAFMARENGKKCIYSTDTELSSEDFFATPEKTDFFDKADVLIMDSQYTMNEAVEKTGWGHSAFSTTVDFAINWDVKKLVLFHHEPTYSDKKIFSLKQSAHWYREYAGKNSLDIAIACEGLEISL